MLLLICLFIDLKTINSLNGSVVTLTCSVTYLKHIRWIYLRTGEIVSYKPVYQFISTVSTGGQYKCFAYNDNCNHSDDTIVNGNYLE